MEESISSNQQLRVDDLPSSAGKESSILTRRRHKSSPQPRVEKIIFSPILSSSHIDVWPPVLRKVVTLTTWAELRDDPSHLL